MVQNPPFKGSHYNPHLDLGRLGRQLDRIYNCMKDGQWRTLREIEELTQDPAASISAQLRNLRKKPLHFRIEVRRRGDRKSGLFEYRLLPPSGAIEESGQYKFC